MKVNKDWTVWYPDGGSNLCETKLENLNHLEKVKMICESETVLKNPKTLYKKRVSTPLNFI